MSSFSDYTENAVLNHLFRNVALSSPAAVYLALYTVAPTDAGELHRYHPQASWTQRHRSRHQSTDLPMLSRSQRSLRKATKPDRARLRLYQRQRLLRLLLSPLHHPVARLLRHNRQCHRLGPSRAGASRPYRRTAQSKPMLGRSETALYQSHRKAHSKRYNLVTV